MTQHRRVIEGRRVPLAVVLTLLTAAPLGCREESPRYLQQRLPDITVMGTPAPAGRPPNRQQRRKRKRYRDAPVYLDGRFVGMLKFSELPPQLPTILRQLEDGRTVLRFAWSDYLRSIGVSLERVQVAHLYGGRDIICVVPGDELRRTEKAFRFSFTRGASGLPRLELPPGGVKYNTYVDKVRALAVYVDKQPPRYENDELRMPDGQLVAPNVFPYADGERHGGTRVYLDGTYRAAFKRRNLKPALQRDPGQHGSPYDMGASLRAFGVDMSQVKRARLFDRRDGVLLDLAGSDLKRLTELSYTLPQHNRGRIMLAASDGSKPVAVESVALFGATEPADRKIPSRPAGQPSSATIGSK